MATKRFWRGLLRALGPLIGICVGLVFSEISYAQAAAAARATRRAQLPRPRRPVTRIHLRTAHLIQAVPPR